MMLYDRYDSYSWTFTRLFGSVWPFVLVTQNEMLVMKRTVSSFMVVQVPCARTKTGHYNGAVRRASPTFFCCYFCYVDYKNCASFSPDVTANYYISICQKEHYEITKTSFDVYSTTKKTQTTSNHYVTNLSSALSVNWSPAGSNSVNVFLGLGLPWTLGVRTPW